MNRPVSRTSPWPVYSVRSIRMPSTRSVPRIRSGAREEVQVHPARIAAPVAQRPPLQGPHHHLDVLGRADLGGGDVVELDVGRVDDHLDARDVVELAQLHRAEPGVGDPATGEHVHVGGRVAGEAGVDRVRDLGARQVLGGARQDPGDVQGHVPGTDHRDRRRVERPVPGHVGVAVVPLHEAGGTVAARQVDPGDVEVPVRSQPVAATTAS